MAERMSPPQLEKLCDVLDEKYRRCTKETLIKDVIKQQNSPMRITEVCGPIFLQFDQYCMQTGVWKGKPPLEAAAADK
jgi:hypothetical protein